MKYVKILGLLAVTAAALMAFAGTASATTVTGGPTDASTGTAYTGLITAESEGETALDGAFTTVKCQKSHVEGTVGTHGAGVTASGTISTLSFTECNFPVTVEAFGSLEIHPVKTTASGVEACGTIECTGTLTSSGAKVKIHTSVGECVFTTTNTDVGLLTPSNDVLVEGKPSTATFDIGAHGSGKIPRTAGNFLCGSTGQWTGSYKVTTPDRLWIDA